MIKTNNHNVIPSVRNLINSSRDIDDHVIILYWSCNDHVIIRSANQELARIILDYPIVDSIKCSICFDFYFSVSIIFLNLYKSPSCGWKSLPVNLWSISELRFHVNFRFNESYLWVIQLISSLNTVVLVSEHFMFICLFVLWVEPVFHNLC